MNDRSTNWQALAVVKDPAGAVLLTDALRNEGMTVTVLSNAEEALAHCKNSPPDLVVVEDRLGTDSGLKLIGDLLAISWTTATVLITTDSADEVHERTEGLGILGSISDYTDREGLKSLLINFRRFKGA